MDKRASHFRYAAIAAAVCLALTVLPAAGCGMFGASHEPGAGPAITAQRPPVSPGEGASAEPSPTVAPTETPRADVTDMEITIEGGDWAIPWDETRRVRVTCKLDGKPADITGQCVYTTGDASILSAGCGVIRGVGAGEADLIAAFGGHSVSARVEVLDANPKNVWLYDEKIQLPLALYGAGGMRYAMILCSGYDNGKTYNATRQASWRVEDPAVATVDARGAVTALKAGKTTIVAQYGEFTAKAALTVFGGQPDRLTVDIGAGEASKKTPLALNVLLRFGNNGEYPAAECVNVYNRSPKTADVAFTDGKIVVTGVKAGKAEIVVSAFGLSKMVSITVK